MEFTPVGFIKSKRNSTQTQVVSPTKVPNANNGDENEGPVKKDREEALMIQLTPQGYLVKLHNSMTAFQKLRLTFRLVQGQVMLTKVAREI